MRTYDSPAEAVLPASRALRDRDASGAGLWHDDLGSVVISSGALYFGARSGDNAVDGVVIRVPPGAYRVIATLAEGSAGGREVVAVSVLLSGETEALRGTLPAGAFWHEAPGDLPLIPGAEIAVTDAEVRDQYRSHSWPWDGWLRDVVDPELAAARQHGRGGTAVTYPGREDALIVAAPIAGDAALFAAFDDANRPTALHLEALPAAKPAPDAPPPWVTHAAAVPSVDPEPEHPDRHGASAPAFGIASQGSAASGGQAAAQTSAGPGQSPFGTSQHSPFAPPAEPAQESFGQGTFGQGSFAQGSSSQAQFAQASFGQAQGSFAQGPADAPASPSFGVPPIAFPGGQDPGAAGQTSAGRPPADQAGHGPSQQDGLHSFAAYQQAEVDSSSAHHGQPSPFRAHDDADALARVPDGGDEDAPISASALGSLTGEQPVTTHTPPVGAPAPAPGQFAGAEPAPEQARPEFNLRGPATPPAQPAQPAMSTQNEPDDPVVGLIVSDATSGFAAAERRDTETAIPLLIKVTDALAAGEASRPGVIPALEAASLNGAQLVDSLVDVLLIERRAAEAIQRLISALGSDPLRGAGEETVHLRHRLGELQLRAGALEDATATLEQARSEADALASAPDPSSRDAANVGRNYLAHITYDLATTQLRAGNTGPAAELALDAMRTFEDLRVARMAGRGAFLAASAYEQLGHEASRQQAFAEAERIFREGRELDGLGTALGYLGEADALRGDYQPAILKFEQARAALEEAGELHSAAVAAENEAVCYDHLGRHEQAGKLRSFAASLEGRAATAGA